MNELKETLAVLSGLEAKTPEELDSYSAIIDEILKGKRRSIARFSRMRSGPVTAEQLYVNQKVSDLISNAEMEQSDYRRGGKPNVFFGAGKTLSRDEGQCVRFQYHRADRFDARAAGLAPLDFAAAARSAKREQTDDNTVGVEMRKSKIEKSKIKPA